MYRQTLHGIFEFAEPELPNLTVEMICRLHSHLMRTSRVLHVDLGSRQKVSYINVGTTRQVSQVNVTARTASSGRRMKVQFCPYGEINPELETFCERFNVSLNFTKYSLLSSITLISHTIGTYSTDRQRSICICGLDKSRLRYDPSIRGQFKL